MVKHRRYEGMTGRQILDSFNLHHENLFYKVRDFPTCLLIGRESKFSRCSSNPESKISFDDMVKELEAKKLPYRVVKRLEWFRPTEEDRDDDKR